MVLGEYELELRYAGVEAVGYSTDRASAKLPGTAVPVKRG